MNAENTETKELEVPSKIYIRKVSAFTYSPIIQDKDNGELQIEYTQHIGGRQDYTVRIASFPLISIFLDESNLEAPVICKAYAEVDKTEFYPLTPEAIDDLSEKQLKNYELKERRHNGRLIAELFSYSMEETIFGKVERNISVDPFGEIILFNSKRKPYTGGDWTNPYFIYDNKAAVMEDLLDQIHRISGAKLAGQDLINKELISDEVFEELGFIKVEDKLGSSQPMWLGNPEGVLEPTGGLYTERKKKTEDMVDNFLELLQIDLA